MSAGSTRTRSRGLSLGVATRRGLVRPLWAPLTHDRLQDGGGDGVGIVDDLEVRADELDDRPSEFGRRSRESAIRVAQQDVAARTALPVGGRHDLIIEVREWKPRDVGGNEGTAFLVGHEPGHAFRAPPRVPGRKAPIVFYEGFELRSELRPFGERCSRRWYRRIDEDIADLGRARVRSSDGEKWTCAAVAGEHDGRVLGDDGCEGFSEVKRRLALREVV